KNAFIIDDDEDLSSSSEAPKKGYQWSTKIIDCVTLCELPLYNEPSVDLQDESCFEGFTYVPLELQYAQPQQQQQQQQQGLQEELLRKESAEKNKVEEERSRRKSAESAAKE